MLKTDCIHPELLRILASCGHGDKLLIADGNYPFDSNVNKNAARIYLNLTRGIPLVTDVLKVLNNTISIENIEVMIPDSGEEPSIFNEFRKILDKGMELNKLGRFKFYEESKKDNIKMVIATGEQRVYANILVTIGIV